MFYFFLLFSLSLNHSHRKILLSKKKLLLLVLKIKNQVLFQRVKSIKLHHCLQRELLILVKIVVRIKINLKNRNGMLKIQPYNNNCIVFLEFFLFFQIKYNYSLFSLYIIHLFFIYILLFKLYILSSFSINNTSFKRQTIIKFFKLNIFLFYLFYFIFILYFNLSERYLIFSFFLYYFLLNSFNFFFLVL